MREKLLLVIFLAAAPLAIIAGSLLGATAADALAREVSQRPHRALVMIGLILAIAAMLYRHFPGAFRARQEDT